MAIPEEQIRATERRYAERTSVREDLLRKIDLGSVLEVDSPSRVLERVARLSRTPAIAAALARAIILADASAPYTSGDRARTLLENVLTGNGLLPVNYLEKALNACRPVGRVHAETRNQAVSAPNTGFLISPRVLLTSFHLLANPGDAVSSAVEFDYQLGTDDEPVRSCRFGLEPEGFLLSNERLDYCLIAVREYSQCGIALHSFGWHKLIPEGTAILGEFLNIVQHPEGSYKQLALRENQIVDVLPDFLHYRTETAHGCSGAPVFNDQWELVGLHHSGVPRRDAHGQI
ncbi:MAG: serine protease [Bryobacteraceae bacterium]